MEAVVIREYREAFEAGAAYEYEKNLNRYCKINLKEAFEMYLNEPQKFILKFGERDAA